MFSFNLSNTAYLKFEKYVMNNTYLSSTYFLLHYLSIPSYFIYQMIYKISDKDLI